MNVSALLSELVMPPVLFGLILTGFSSPEKTVIETRYETAVADKKEPGPWAYKLLTQAQTSFPSKEGRFSITLPPAFPTFKHTQQTQPTSVGNVELHIYLSEISSGACMLGYSDFPPDSFEGRSAQKILEDGSAGSLKNLNGTLEKQESITVQGYPGLAGYGSGESDGKKFYVRFEFVLVKPRAYQIGYLAYDRTDLDKPEIQAYFKSFRVEN